MTFGPTIPSKGIFIAPQLTPCSQGRMAMRPKTINQQHGHATRKMRHSRGLHGTTGAPQAATQR